MEQTIAAISTSTMSSGGISIVRISGENAISVADTIFEAKNNKKLSKADSHTIHYGVIKDGDEVIDIAMASGLSGTYQTAMMAKDSCDNPDLVHVVDSQTLCGPHRLMVDTALEMANNGASAKDIVKLIVQSRMQEESYLVPVDFQFLVRGGRIKGLAATLGGALKLIPILKKGVDGIGLDKFGVSRTYKKAVNMVVEDFKNNGFDSNYTFYISHAFNEDLAMMFEKKIKETFEGVKVVIYPLSPAFITQGGPGCVAVQAIKMA